MSTASKILLLIGTFLTFLTMANASEIYKIEADTVLPKVFLIGEFEAEYEALIQRHPTLLFSACEMDMELAYSKWVSMLEEIELASEDFGLDLKGVKIWLNVFWEKDGSISNLAYFLKPVSRNVDLEELDLFFADFIASYRFPMIYDKKYSHYGTASFPVFAKVIQEDTSQGKVTKGQ